MVTRFNSRGVKMFTPYKVADEKSPAETQKVKMFNVIPAGEKSIWEYTFLLPIGYVW